MKSKPPLMVRLNDFIQRGMIFLMSLLGLYGVFIDVELDREPYRG